MRSLAILLVVPAMLSGCDIFEPRDCARTDSTAGMLISVVSALDASPVSEGLVIRVESRNGGHFEEIEPVGNVAGAAHDRPGRYDISVAATAYQTEVLSGILVGDDECGVVTQRVTVEMTPEEAP